MTAADIPISNLQLRCGSCGAPYARLAPGEIQICTYCGTAQRTVDARQFLDHFMAQVTAFVRQAVPIGLDVSRSQTIDPVARLSAFNSSIRPRLTTESDQYRFACFNLLSSPLAILPFSSGLSVPGGTDPATVSVFVAKTKSVSGLAVDDASRELLQRASGLASCYQSLLVASRLANSQQPERYHLIAQNYATASDAIASSGHWPPLALRLAALSAQTRATDLLLTGRELGEARRWLSVADESLSRARTMLSAAPELGYMVTAVDQELSVVRTVGAMLEIAEKSPMFPPPPTVYVERLVGVLNWLAHNTPGDWGTSFASIGTRELIFVRAAQLRAAQAGCGSVKVVLAGSGTFVPFWVVELPYTFETGVLWAKRGKQVPEILLVAATFATDTASVTGAGSGRVLTDVFSASSGGSVIGAYYSRVRGRQEKITESGGLAHALQYATVSSMQGLPAIPPFSTEAQALRLVQRYIDGVRYSNPKVASQLRASSPRILDLVYVPCSLNTSPPVPWLGPLSPISLGNPESLSGFVG